MKTNDATRATAEAVSEIKEKIVAGTTGSITADDLMDLNDIDDVVLAIRRKLLVISALIKSASGFSEDLAARQRNIQSEHHAMVLIYELEHRIDNALAFADEADAKLIGVTS